MQCINFLNEKPWNMLLKQYIYIYIYIYIYKHYYLAIFNESIMSLIALRAGFFSWLDLLKDWGSGWNKFFWVFQKEGSISKFIFRYFHQGCFHCVYQNHQKQDIVTKSRLIKFFNEIQARVLCIEKSTKPFRI